MSSHLHKSKGNYEGRNLVKEVGEMAIGGPQAHIQYAQPLQTPLVHLGCWIL